ncbi:MAG: PIG-L family deacetylase [Actinomycetota bacterium]|nr:PIG-L family deacetylase [Actinomycetota bacterium]
MTVAGDAGVVARVLVVAAHPDDVDFGMAGTVATWTAAGTEVAYLIVTDGDAGGFDRSISRPEMAAMRRDEQRAAAKTVGVDQVMFLGYTDGRLVPSIELRRDISRVVRQFRPDRLVCQSPERTWQRIGASHPDHLAAGEAAVCAVYPDARNPFAHPELLAAGLEPHIVPELWLMAGREPNHYVDVTDTAERKLAALRCHASQLPEVEAVETRVRGWLAATAAAGGLPEGRLAEAFQVVHTA